MGNFINQELYGRATDAPWGVLFPSDPSRLPRHPSQIYQAVLEGLLLFLFLHFYQRIMVKSGRFKHGMIGAWYLILFGFFRFCVEFAREPDAQLGYYFGWMTMGQILCVIMSLIGVGVLLHVRKSQESFDPKKSELIVDG